MAKSKGDGNKNSLKETEIGMIPEDWNVERLGDVAELLRGLSWRKEEANKSGRGLPVVAIPNIGIGTLNFDFHHFLTREVSTKKLLKRGDILFVGSSGSIRNIGRNVLVRFLPLDKISFASFLALIRAEKGKVTSDFLYYLINSKWIDFKKFTKRAADGKYNFQLRDFQSNATIPLPSPHEQQKIARVLSKIQQAIEQQDKIIEATKNLKKSLMQKLFTEGLGHTEFKETEIGQIPKRWKVVNILQSLKKKRSKVGKIRQREYKTIGKYPVVDQGKKYIAGYCDDEEKVYAGDLPVAIFGDHTRIIKYVDFPFVIGADGVKILLVKREIFHPRFFYYALENLEIESRGYNRHFPILKEKKIPCPPLREQEQIAHILSIIDKKIEVEEKRKSTLKELFKTMLHKLMTGEIRLKEIEL